MESISRKNGCPVNHICQKICKAVAGSTSTTTDHLPDQVEAESRAAITTTGSSVVIEKPPPPNKDKKSRVVSFEPPQQTMVTKSTGVHVEDRFGDYIGRVKKKLMTLSNKQNSNDEFSDYIGHVKNNFNRNPSTTATIYMEH
ncbi:hypothetical protein LINPERHAP1_LOCUS41654 [Linum perenne]